MQWNVAYVAADQTLPFHVFIVIEMEWDECTIRRSMLRETWLIQIFELRIRALSFLELKEKHFEAFTM